MFCANSLPGRVYHVVTPGYWYFDGGLWATMCWSCSRIAEVRFASQLRRRSVSNAASMVRMCLGGRPRLLSSVFFVTNPPGYCLQDRTELRSWKDHIAQQDLPGRLHEAPRHRFQSRETSSSLGKASVRSMLVAALAALDLAHLLGGRRRNDIRFADTPGPHRS